MQIGLLDLDFLHLPARFALGMMGKMLWNFMVIANELQRLPNAK